MVVIRYNVPLMQRHAAERGWNQSDLASAARISAMSVTRFFRGVQTPRIAAKLTKALGRPAGYYIKVHAKQSARLSKSAPLNSLERGR